MIDKEKYFLQIYEELKDKIYRLCLGFMGNTSDADDLFQEVLVKIWINLKGFRDESSINTWVYKITTNTALTSLNKISRSKSRQLNILPENSNAEKNQIDYELNEDRVLQLYKAISHLKEMDRIIISLLLEDNSYKDIAEITGISTSNVGVRISRIKKKLTSKFQ